MVSMKGFIQTLLFTVSVLQLGCSGGSDSGERPQGGGGGGGGSSNTTNLGQGSDSVSPDVDLRYDEITILTGFTSEYLDGKTFYEPLEDSGTEYLITYSFTDTSVTINNELADSEDTYDYDTVVSNVIAGVLTYGNISVVHYNVFVVENDHLKLCSTESGIDTVIACDIAQTNEWYFDESSARANFP